MSDAGGAIAGLAILVVLLLGIWKAVELIIKIARRSFGYVRRERIADEDEALRKKIEAKLKSLKRKRRS